MTTTLAGAAHLGGGARGDHRPAGPQRAAAGAPLFMLADGLRAWDRFGPMRPAAPWVLATYYLSLRWIARPVAREGSIVEAGASQ